MKIIVMAICRNQAHILPWFLRHYVRFADEISVWDDRSDDGSRELLQACPKVILRDWPYDNGLDDNQFLEFAYEWYPRAIGLFDWVMWVDCDEFIYDPDIEGVLAECDNYDIIQTVGFNMTGDGLPADDGRQLWEVMPMGVPAPVYSKPIVFKPHIRLRWNRGRHAIEETDGFPSVSPMLKLLHYRYLGYEYTKARNVHNYDRCGLKTGDKAAAWSCSDQWIGEHSPKWAEEAKAKAIQVV